jgi:hypothetical protein
MNSWALMVALIGEGQEIHRGEESGLAQWNDALSVMTRMNGYSHSYILELKQ